MNSSSRPTTIRVFGTSLVGPPAAPFKRYVYNGADRSVPKKTRPGAPGCVVEGCGFHAHAKGYCNTHLYRLRVHGDPLAPDHRRKENRA